MPRIRKNRFRNTGRKMSGKDIQRHEAAKLSFGRKKGSQTSFNKRAYGALGRANRRGFIAGLKKRR